MVLGYFDCDYNACIEVCRFVCVLKVGDVAYRVFRNAVRRVIMLLFVAGSCTLMSVNVDDED